MILDKPIDSPEPVSRDDDYDYDVYYFMPSCPPYIISPAYFDTIDQLAHPAFNLQAFLEDNIPTHLIAPISLPESSDYVFPEVEDESALEGYSRVFRAGLRHEPGHSPHRFEIIKDAFQDVVRATWRKFRLWA